MQVWRSTIKEHIARIASAVVKYVLFFNALLSASQFSDVSLKFLELSSITACFRVRGEKRKELLETSSTV